MLYLYWFQGTLGIKQPKVLRHLVEMVELDPSDYVRRDVIRTFGTLQTTDCDVIRVLRERERGDGMLAAEAKKVLDAVEALSWHNEKRHQTLMEIVIRPTLICDKNTAHTVAKQWSLK